jgi:hypothetical protein
MARVVCPRQVWQAWHALCGRRQGVACPYRPTSLHISAALAPRNDEHARPAAPHSTPCRARCKIHYLCHSPSICISNAMLSTEFSFDRNLIAPRWGMPSDMLLQPTGNWQLAGGGHRTVQFSLRRGKEAGGSGEGTRRGGRACRQQGGGLRGGG